MKLLTILGNLIERKTIKQDFEPKYTQLVDFLEAEMDSTKRIYDEQKRLKDTKNEVLVHRNMPDVSGALKWCQELKDRISKPMDNFRKLVDAQYQHTEHMDRVDKKYKELLELLTVFSTDIYKDWCNHVGKFSDDNLEKNLITRNPDTREIKTNFDPQVISIALNHLKLSNFNLIK